MLCVIPSIREYVFKILNGKHQFQVENVIKTLCVVSTDKELNETLDTFWSEYTKSNHKNDPFDSNESIWNSRYISDGNSHMWHQKYSLPSTKVLGVVSCRVTSKVFGIWSVDRSWGDVKTIKSGNISALESDISAKQRIYLHWRRKYWKNSIKHIQ